MAASQTTQTSQSAPMAPGLFILYYRQGMNPHPMQKNFEFSGDFKSAIERGKAHCETMGLRFISVRPFITDLQAEEKRSTD